MVKKLIEGPHKVEKKVVRQKSRLTTGYKIGYTGKKPTFNLPSPADNLAYFSLLLKLGRLVPDFLV